MPANSIHYIFPMSQTGGIVKKRVRTQGKKTEQSKVKQLVDDGQQLVVSSRSTLRPGVPEYLATAMYINESQWSEATILMETVAKIPSSLRGQNVEVLSNLPQRTSSSLLYTLRAPPKCWIATAMKIVEPQRPDSGRHVGIQADCRGRSGTMVINESGEGKDNTIYQQKHA